MFLLYYKSYPAPACQAENCSRAMKPVLPNWHYECDPQCQGEVPIINLYPKLQIAIKWTNQPITLSTNMI